MIALVPLKTEKIVQSSTKLSLEMKQTCYVKLCGVNNVTYQGRVRSDESVHLTMDGQIQDWKTYQPFWRAAAFIIP